jgi:hypothetical protein
VGEVKIADLNLKICGNDFLNEIFGNEKSIVAKYILEP